MNKTYVIKINSATATVQNVQVTSGQSQPTTVKVDGNVNVEVLDTATGKAPHKISVRRVGKDLHVAFEGGDPAHSDLILQDFYGENDNHLVGLAESGQYFEYIPTSGEGGFYVPLLSEGTDAIQALGGAELAGAAWAPMFASAFPIGAVLGAIGAIGLAGVAIAAGGGSHKVEALTTPTQRPNSYLDNVGPVQNPNSTATLTDDTTPGLHIGALPAGATGAVLYVDGVIKPATYDPATGTLTPSSPLPDGVHTLGYGLTNSVGTTPSSPTLTLTIDSTAPPAPILHVADTDGDGKPNLTGTGEPGGLVTITDPAGGKHTTMVDPTGKFELEIDMPSKPLGEWIATVTDPADNVSLPGKTIVTDLTAPTAPVAGVYDNVGSIQGLVPNKGVTDDATPAVSGTAEPGSVVTIMNDGKPVGTALADGSGVWSFTLPPLVDGTYTVTTKATDSQGNTGPTSVPVVFTVDTLAPPATTASTLTDDVGRIQGPIVNGTITDDANPTFTGKAEAGATITIRDGGIVQGTALVDAGGNWTYPSTTLAPGAHSFTATVTDPAGNVSPATTPINFTVDLTVPTIAVNQVKDDVGPILGALKAGDVTDDNKPTVTGTGTPGGVVKLYLDGTTTVIGTTVVDSSGQWAITPTTPLVDGKHDLTVTVTTVATGENPPTAPFALTVDTTPPGAPAIVSADDNVGRIQGHVTSGVPSDDTTPLLTGKAEAGSVVRIFDGGQLIGSAIADGSGIWTLTPSLVDGVHPITMTATDKAGNVSAPSAPWNVVIDTAAPTTPTVITQVFDDQGSTQGIVASGIGTIIDDDHPDFTGTAEANTTVIVKDGAVEIGTAAVNASGIWTFTPLAPLLNGIHHVTASAMDTAGNIGPVSSVFDFRLITGGVPTAPAITTVIDDVGTVSVVVPNGVTNDSTPRVEGTALAGSTVKLYAEDGTLLGTTTSDVFGQWSITTLPLSEGAHSLVAKAVDLAGNLSAPTGPYPFVVDTLTPNTATGLLLKDDVGPVVGAITNGMTTDDATPTFSGMAEAGATVTVSDGTTVLGTAKVNPDGTWTFTSPHLENGTHSFSAIVTDPAGNVAPATTPINFTLDASAVKISIDEVFDDAAPITGVLAMNASTNDSTPTVSGSSAPGGVIKLYLDGTTAVIGTATADSTGHWVITPTAPLVDGLHNLTATVTTPATGESLATSAFKLTVDTALPATPTIVSAYDNVGRIQGNVAAGTPSDDTTPRLTGKAEAGSTVAVFDGSVYLGATIADTAGNWTFTPVSPLNNGTHPITVTATDAAGNVSLPSLPWALLIDTIAPTVVPVITTVVDDQGPSQGLLATGVTTDDARPAFTGTAEANTTVVIRDGTVELGTALVNASGVWTFTPPSLLFNGFHHVTASELDAAGNVGPASVPFDFRLISGGIPTAPAITNVIDDVGTISNVEPFGLTNDRTPTVEGTAVAGSIVSLFSEDGTPLGTATADARGQWSITTPSLADGPHSLTATATDTTGIPSAPTGPYQIVVDATLPKVATNPVLTDNVGTVTGPILNNGVTDDATPTFTGSAEAGATVSVKDNGSELGTALVDAAGNWTFTSPHLEPGLHAFTATVMDAAGNASAPTTPINFTLDASGVAIAIDQVLDDFGPIIGVLAMNASTDDRNPTVSGTATVGGTVKLYLDGTTTVIGTATADSAGHWVITPVTSLVNGLHNLTATVTTATAVESPATAAFTLTVDSIAPSRPAILSAVDNVGSIQGTIPVGSVAPTDDTTPGLAGTADPGTTVTIFDAGQPIGTALTDAAGVWKFTPASPLSDGTHPLTVKAADAAGNVSAASAPWNLLIDTVAPTIVPLITLVYDDQGATQGDVSSPSGVTDDSLPLISGTSEPNGSVIIRDGLAVIGTAAVNAAGVWNFLPTTVLVNGAHILSATAVDAAGNVGLSSPVRAFTVVTGGIPTAPAITNVLDDLGGIRSVPRHGSTKDTTPTVEGTAKPGETVSLFNEDGVPIGTIVADINGQWLITSPALLEGAHSFTATSTDLAGNVSAPTAPYQIVVDFTVAAATVPVLTDNVGPIVSIPDYGVTDDATPTFTGKAEAGTTVTVMDGIASLGTTLVNAAGDWSFTPKKPLDPGAHAFTAIVTDAAGNVSAPTAPIHFTVDLATQIVEINTVTDDVIAITGPLAQNDMTNDARPTVSGKATAGGVVKLYDETGAMLGAAVADNAGHWTITPAFDLPEGKHDLTATVTTSTAPESAATAAFTLTVDTTKPIPPVIVSVTDDVGSIRGLEVPGAPSDDTTPTLTGTAEALSTVTILDGTVQIGTAAVDAKGNWTFTPISPLNEGVHAITTTATDAAGNVSLPSAPWSLLVDTISPTIVPSITSVYDDQGVTQGNVPNNPVWVTDDSLPLISGTSEPNGSVIIKDGTMVLGTAAVNSAGVWSFLPTTVLINGVHILSATAVDAAGNVGLMSPVHAFTVVTGGIPTAPAITNVLDDVGGVRSIPQHGFTKDTTPTVEGTAKAGETVRLYNEDGVPVGSTIADINGQWFITSPALVEGAHSFTATATNLAGNVSAPTAPYQIVVDITKPGMATNLLLNDDVGPKIGLILDKDTTDDATPTYTGNAEAGTTVTVMDGITKLGTALVDAAGKWSFTSPHLEDGAHVFSTIVTDTAGNVSPATTPIHFTLNASAVAIAIDQVLDDIGPVFGVLAMNASTNDRNPTVSGTATAGGLVKLYLDGSTTVIGSATADSTGHWVITPTVPLVEGKHDLTATVTVGAGSPSTPTAAFTLTVDSIAPIAPVIVSVTDDVGSIRGLEVPGAPSDDTTPTLTGTAEPLTTVTILDGTVQIGTAAVDAKGNWTFTPISPLNEGVHAITTTATDAAGNVSPPSLPWSLLVDTISPAIVPFITSVYDDQGVTQGNVPNNPAWVTDDSLPLISGTSEPNGSVIIKDGTMVLGTAAVNSAGVWSFLPTTVLINGVHILSATAVDAAGNVGLMSPVHAFTVVTGGIPTAPAITNVLDDVGGVRSIPQHGFTKDTTPTVEGTAKAGETVRLYNEDGVPVGSTIADINGQWFITSPALVEGAHSFTATATNLAGNVSAPTAPYQIVVDFTIAAATAAVLNDDVGPKTGLILDHDTTDDATPTYTGKAEAGATVIVMDGITKLGTTLVNAAGDWSYKSPHLEDGAHVFTAIVTDAAGNVSAPTAPIHFTLNASAVAVAIDQVLDDVSAITGLLAMNASTNDTMPTVSGTATAGGLVKLYLDGTTIVIGTATADSAGHWVITPTAPLADGLHNLTATVTTATVPESTATAAFTLTVDTVKPIAPIIVSVTDDVGSIRGLEVPGAPSDDTTPTLKGTAEPLTTVTILDGTVQIGTAATDAKGNWTFTPISPLNEGVHAITTTATDAAGNVSPPSAPWSLLIDTISPTIVPVITSVYDDQGVTQGNVPNNPVWVTDDSLPLISGTSEPNGSVVIRDGLAVLGTAAVNSAGVWSFLPTTVLVNGAHILSATAVDAAGNVGLSSLVYTFTVVTGGIPTAPAITNVLDDVSGYTSVPRHGVTKDTTPTVEGTARAGETVRLYNEDGVQVGTIVADINGQWLITSPALLEGAHSFTATATDLAGNVSPPTAPYQIVVDLTVAAATVPVLTDNVGPIVSIPDHGFTDDATPTLTGKAEAGTTVTVLDGIEKLGTTLVNAAGDWSFTSPHLQDGAHVFTAIVTDAAGNVSAPTTPIHFTLDTSLLNIVIDQVLDDVSPIAGLLAMNASTNDTMPTVSGTATAGGLVKLYLDGTTIVIGTATADSAGHWVITPTAPLADGLHNLTATVTTATVPESTATAAFTLTVDTVKPIAPIIVSVTDDVGSIRGLEVPGAPSDDTTPTLKGTAEPLTTVTILDGTVKIGTAATDAKGNWTFTPISPLNEGVHAITTTATDAAGNVSLPSAPWSLLIDTLSPTTVPVITSVYDDQGLTTGTVANNITIRTDDSLPLVSGTSEPNGSVIVKDGLTVIGTAAVDSAGLWTFMPTTVLLNGPHVLTATAVDAAGNTGLTSATYSFLLITGGLPTSPAITNVIDDVGTVSNIEPNGVTNDQTPTVKGTALQGAVVSLFSETGVLLGTVLVDANGQWSITTPTLTPGPHSFTATATNVSGNVSLPTDPYPITVDITVAAATAPVLTDNVGPTIGQILNNGFTDDATPTLTGKAEAGTTVTVMDGIEKLGTTPVNAAGDWSFTSPHLEDGIHVFTAIVTDPAGNVSAPTTPIHFTLDASAVVIAIDQVLDDINPIAGVLAMNASTDDARPMVSGTATAGGLVKLYLDGTTSVIGSTTADSTGHWVITPVAPLADGLHNLTATVTTSTAPESTATAAFTLTVDTTRPIQPVIVSSTDDVGLHKGLIANGGPSDDSTPTLRGTAEPLSTVTLYDGTVKIGTAATDATGNWFFTPASPLNDGTHPITATATDAAGNVSLPSATWNELIDTNRPVTPVIVTVNDNVGIYTGDLTSGTPSDDNTPTLTGTAEALSTVTIKDNGTPIATVLANAAGIWTFTPTTATKLLDGTHPLTVTSTDAAGNESQPASFLSVIDTSPPSTPFIDFSNDNVVLYTGDLPSNTPTNDTTPRMSGRAEPLSKVELFDGLTIVGSTMADAAGNWVITPTLTAQGAHPMTVTATDAAGNISVHSATWIELIDTVKPISPVIVSSGDDVVFYIGNIPSGVPTNDTTPLIKGTSEANALINLFDNGVLTGTTLANALGDWSYTPTLASQGAHAMTATATDAAGNTSPPSLIWTVNLDTIAPLAGSFGIGASNDNFGIYQGNIGAGVPTNDDTPLMSGTAEAGSLISLYDAGVVKGTATADALGNWNFEPTLISSLAGQGIHAMTITSTDVAGNVSGISPGWNIQLDTIAPAFSSNPATAVNERTGAGTVIYTAAAADVSGVTYAIVPGVDSGLFSINSTTGQVTMNFTPDYEAPGDVGGNNVYDYVVKATDVAGNVTTQNASLSVLDVLDTPPVISVANAAGFPFLLPISAGSVIFFASAQVPVSWSLSGANAGRFSIDSNGVVRINNSYTQSSPIATYLFTIVAVDAFGQSDTHNSSFAITTPVGFDLNADGLVDYGHNVIDLRGDGHKQDTSWVSKEDGVLVWDKYHDGQVHDSSQYAFAQYVSGAKTDLEGLKAFDTNGNGKLDSGDALWKEMNVWQDLNGNGVSDAGEVKTLAAWGIASIGLTSDGVVSNPAAGVQEFGKTSATLEDGTQMVVADAAFTATYHPGDHGDAVAQPFFVDMNHDGQITYDKALIDVSGTGYKELIAWAGKGDGVLVWDKYQDGLVHDSSQYSFGSLKIFDTSGDSKLDSHDVLWSQLSVWQDANGDGVSDAGEVKTLAQLGIQSIGLSSDGVVTTPAEGVKELGKSAAVMEDGSAMTIAQAAVSHVTTDLLHPLSYLDQTYAVI